MARPISELFRHQGTLYVYCSGPTVKEQFARHLIEQGFCFRDGATPARRQIDRLMCVHCDFTISFCGFICHMQCGNLENPAYVLQDCFDGCTRIDYARFLSGAEDYVIQGQRPKKDTTAILEYW